MSSSSSISGDLTTNIYTVDEEANDKTTKSFQCKGGSTPSVSTVKEEKLDVILYYPQQMTTLERDIQGVKRIVCKGGGIALENGNPPVRVVVEGWHEAIGKQVNQLSRAALDKGHVCVFKYDWDLHLGDPYFLAYVSRDTYCKVLFDGEESYFIGDVSSFIIYYSFSHYSFMFF